MKLQETSIVKLLAIAVPMYVMSQGESHPCLEVHITVWDVEREEGGRLGHKEYNYRGRERDFLRATGPYRRECKEERSI